MPDSAPTVRSCGSMAVHYRLLTTDLSYGKRLDQIENEFIEYASGRNQLQRSGITRIPVVVHIVYNELMPDQNISDEQVVSQIDALNLDFRKKNPDISSIPAAFQLYASDARIEFFLAATDPNGGQTSGITRTKTNLIGFDDDNSVKITSKGGIDPWPTERYLNIWVCKLKRGLLGYAQFPGGPAATDGVVITYTAFGTMGSAKAPFNLGRTTTHEVGHWLNLRHIWGDDGTGCNGTDFVDDTPNQAGPNTGKPTFPSTSCNNGPNGDMYMNYMDYSDDASMFMFTAGQVLRMQATLDSARRDLGA